jgi:hypothetical protein
MGSWEDIKKNMRDRDTKGPVVKVPYQGDANSRAKAARERDEAARPGRVEANRIARETDRNKYYNADKGRREAAAREAARKSADRLKPPAAPATSSPSPAKKSAVSKILDKVKGNSGKGKGAGIGALRIGGGGGTSRVR